MNSLLRLGATSLAIALLPVAGAAAQAPIHKELTVDSSGGSYTRSQMLAYVKPFRSRIGEWVKMERYNGGLDEIREQVETENVEWDVVDFELSDLIRGCREGLLEKVDHGAGAAGTPVADDFSPAPLPSAESVRWCGRPSSPTTGARSRGSPLPRSRTSSTSRSFPGSGGYDATRGSPWNARMYRAMVEEGKDYGIVRDGQLWDIDPWGIPKGIANLAKATDCIAFATRSGNLAEQTKYISYGPARMSAMALVDDRTKAMLPTAEANMATALQTDAYWWATHHEALSASFEKWLAKGARGLSGTAR